MQEESLETKVWEGRPSHIANLHIYILCVLFCWLLFPIYVGVKKFLEIRCTKYEVTTEQLIISLHAVQETKN